MSDATPAPIRSAPDSPNDGDLVLHCGHVLNTKRHCFYAPDGIRYRRPDGTNHSAKWLLCCITCLLQAEGDPAKIKIRGDGIFETAAHAEARIRARKNLPGGGG